MAVASGRAARPDRQAAPDAEWAAGAANAVPITDRDIRSLCCGLRLHSPHASCRSSPHVLRSATNLLLWRAFSRLSRSHSYSPTLLQPSYSLSHTRRLARSALLFTHLSSRHVHFTPLTVSVTTFSESIQSLLHKSACWSPDLFTGRCCLCLRLRANANAVIILQANQTRTFPSLKCNTC